MKEKSGKFKRHLLAAIMTAVLILPSLPLLSGCKTGFYYDNAGKYSVGDATFNVDDVEAISFNARYGYEQGKKVLYITERCVFELGENGLILTEIAPGFDLEKDILSYLSFKPEISPDLKEMPAICFQ